MKNKSAAQSILTCLFIGLGFAAHSSPARADTPTTTRWIGGSDGNWFNNANWDNGYPVYYSTDALINNGGKTEINTPGATARNLILGTDPGDSGTVSVDGTTQGTLSTTPGCPGNAPSGTGGIYVGYGGRGTFSVTNGGKVGSETGYIAALGAGVLGGYVRESRGTVTVDGAGSTWTIGNCSDYRLFVGASDANTDGGTALLSITNGGSVVVNNTSQSIPPVIVGLSGTLAGNGTLTMNGPTIGSSRALVRGTVAPTGTLRINGSLGLFSPATTVCNVTPEAADRVDVAFSAMLAGRLMVIMKGAFTPATTRYTLLHADGVRELTFQSVSIQTPPNACFTPQITYDGNNVYLDLVFQCE